MLVRSISNGTTPLESLVGRHIRNEHGRVPPVSKFHLIDGNEHFLVIARPRVIIYEGEGAHENPDVFIDVSRVSFQQAHDWPNGPATSRAFIRTISKFPTLKLPFQIGKLDVTLSYEVRQGIAGSRRDDHKISVELLKKCIRVKRNTIYKGKITEFHFFDKETNKVLKMVLRYPDTKILEENRKSVVVLTAFYPQYSSLRYGCSSNVQFKSWQARLPKVRIDHPGAAASAAQAVSSGINDSVFLGTLAENSP